MSKLSSKPIRALVVMMMIMRRRRRRSMRWMMMMMMLREGSVNSITCFSLTSCVESYSGWLVRRLLFPLLKVFNLDYYRTYSQTVDIKESLYETFCKCHQRQVMTQVTNGDIS